ncbi:hypothetical protein EYF80_056442 [Liparis tanakae]|uniref:Uncharacterized protein n=1 Tax=Liparis tanakae TaxID=230148 RepID=A0A4Z2EWW1_9TELE|nr:hypothetical protein EYF80_056442 [Liparis tanakae]
MPRMADTRQEYGVKAVLMLRPGAQDGAVWAVSRSGSPDRSLAPESSPPGQDPNLNLNPNLNPPNTPQSSIPPPQYDAPLCPSRCRCRVRVRAVNFSTRFAKQVRACA